VIEHVDDPYEFLEELDRRAELVAVNLLEPVAGETVLHRPLPTRSLLRRVARRRLVSYRLLHARSHLVLYSPHRAGPIAWLRARRAIRSEFSRATAG
jgi:hypothetical protein